MKWFALATGRSAAVVTWLQAAGFGLPAIPVSVFLLRERKLPWLGGLFPMYGGPWSDSWAPRTMVASFAAFLGISLIAAWGAWLVWHGSRVGAVICVATIPVEAVFWYGYALPFAPPLGIARIVLVAAAWPALGPRTVRVP